MKSMNLWIKLLDVQPNVLFVPWWSVKLWVIFGVSWYLLCAGMRMSVRRVHVSSEPDSSYFLRVDWSGRSLGSGFQLLLTDGQDAWSGDGKKLTQRDLTPCLTFKMLDLTDLCSPDTWTTSPVWPHTHFSHLGTFKGVLSLTLSATWTATLRGRFIHSSQVRILISRYGYC